MPAESRKPRFHRQVVAGLVVLAVAAASVGMYLVRSRDFYRLGFPLDDAWIHQTYARNLAQLGEWSFLPGEPSAGSTSPLWTGLLALGSLLRVEARSWAYFMGSLALLGTAALAANWVRVRVSVPKWLPVAIALTIAVEWHLVWSAASGMETLLLAGTAVLALTLLETATWRPFRFGLVVGLGLWIRPDALTLLAAGAWRAWAQRGKSPWAAVRETLLMLGGAACGLVPYLLFLQWVGGSWWPSTFYAKQAEYAVLRETPLVQRLLAVGQAPLVGAGGLLLVGSLIEAVQLLRARRWGQLAPLVWVAVFIAAYALRLPVTYQHGRYQIPVVAVLAVLGWCGAASWFGPAKDRWRWVLGRAWGGAVAAVLVAFLFLGGRAYSQDVAIIESEMVDTARWIVAHTPADARLAAHDIGALGYFGERDLLDLAGLTDPELIPRLRDESALARAMDAHGVDYLMTFPGWYPMLSACGDPVYVSEGRHSPEAGGENMVVYRWQPETFAARPGCMLYSP